MVRNLKPREPGFDLAIDGWSWPSENRWSDGLVELAIL